MNSELAILLSTFTPEQRRLFEAYEYSRPPMLISSTSTVGSVVDETSSVISSELSDDSYTSIDSIVNFTAIAKTPQNEKTLEVISVIQQAQEEMCTNLSAPKVAVINLTTNGRDSADQFSYRLSEAIQNSTVYTLSSTQTKNISDVELYFIDYAEGLKSKIPIVTALSNTAQSNKVKTLIDRVKVINKDDLRIRLYLIYNEADETYHHWLKNTPEEDFKEMCVSEGIKVYTVTATFHKIKNECADFELAKISPTNQNYRAPHSSDARVMLNEYSHIKKHNHYVNTVLTGYRSHFTSPIPDSDGIYRKVLCVSNVRNADMASLALDAITKHGFLASLTINQLGLTIYEVGSSTTYNRPSNKQLNEFLYDVLRKRNLGVNGPIALIGNKKLVRENTFHYAPRDGTDGLIWTDIILGKINDPTSATQRAGRLSGIIAHCESYSSPTFWTDKKTWDLIIKDYNVVSNMEKHSGKTLSEGVKEAESEFEQKRRAQLTNVNDISVSTPQPSHKRVPMVLPFPLAKDTTFIKMFKAKNKMEKMLYLRDVITNAIDTDDGSLNDKYEPHTLGEFRYTVTSKENHTAEVPEQERSYKLHITDVVRNFENNTPYAMLNFNDKNPNYYKSCWEVFIDTREGRLCVLWQYYPEPTST